MLKKGFLKPNISIDTIGKTKFWTGIIVGIGFTFALSYFLNYSREALRFVTVFGDPYIIPEKEFRVYDLFFALFSTSIGFGFTIIYWLRGINKNIKKKYLQKFTIANSWFIVFISLMCVTRFGSIVPIFLYGTHGFDDHFNFLRDYKLLLVLIPIFVFFVNWNSLRLIFKTKHWILISLLVYAFVCFYIFKTTNADRDWFNKGHLKKNEERFDFIEKEFQKAKKNKIFFSDSLKQVMQKRYAERTTELVQSVKEAFTSGKNVSLDTLILEKIIIHNFNAHKFYWVRNDPIKDRNWSYATPEQILQQIELNKIGSIEMQTLFEIIYEFSIIYQSKRDYENWRSYTRYESERFQFRRTLFYTSETMQGRFIKLGDKLRSDRKYEMYHQYLPKIDFDDQHGRQIFIEME